MTTSATHPEAPSLARQLLTLAWPVALSRLGIMGMGVADTVMVGQMAPAELSHQALGWAPTGPFLVAGIGLLAGVQVLGARAIGEGRPEHAGAVWRIGLALATVTGLIAIALILLFALPLLRLFGIEESLAAPAADVAHILALSIPLHLAYVACAYHLEAIQKPVAGAVVMWAANILNVGANWLLIPHLGAEGSAWATVIARVFLFGALFAWIVTRPEAKASGLLTKPKAGAPGLSAMLGVGVAAAVSQAAEAGAFSAMTVIAGRIGANEVAAYQILLNMLAVVFMVAMGLAAATAVLVSEAKGAQNAPRMAAAGWTGLGINTAFMAGLGLMVVLAAPLIGRAFTADVAVAAVVASQIVLGALIMAPDGGQVVAAAALRARGDNWFPTASHVLAYVIVMPPLALFLAEGMGLGVAGLMWAIFWASVLSVAVLVWRFWRMAAR